MNQKVSAKAAAAHAEKVLDQTAADLQKASDAELNATSAAGAPVHTAETAKVDPPHSNFKFTRKAAVALPLFKLKPGDPERFFLFDGAMHEGKKVDDKKDAALLLGVTDLETGEQGQIIVGFVLKELLVETYPEGAYVGKKFALKVMRQADKKYNTYSLFEIETE